MGSHSAGKPPKRRPLRLVLDSTDQDCAVQREPRISISKTASTVDHAEKKRGNQKPSALSPRSNRKRTAGGLPTTHSYSTGTRRWSASCPACRSATPSLLPATADSVP